ncbi:hypothetical protein HDU96_008312 [Phlyctochytrium bullatum]|nr:hypothetical protein HDU96_008312 [Phlyctochytrium bullatum]
MVNYECPHGDCKADFKFRRSQLIQHLTRIHSKEWTEPLATTEANRQKQEQQREAELQAAAAEVAKAEARLAALMAKPTAAEAARVMTSSSATATSATVIKRKQGADDQGTSEASTGVTAAASPSTQSLIEVSDGDEEGRPLKKVKVEPNGPVNGVEGGAVKNGTASAVESLQPHPPLFAVTGSAIGVGPDLERDIFLVAAELKIKNQAAAANQAPSDLSDAERFVWRIVMTFQDPESAPMMTCAELISRLAAEFGDVPGAEVAAWYQLNLARQLEAIKNSCEIFQSQALERSARALADLKTIRDQIRAEFLEMLAELHIWKEHRREVAAFLARFKKAEQKDGYGVEFGEAEGEN